MIDEDRFRQLVAESVRPVVREELAAAERARSQLEADVPKPAAWWAKRLKCSAESLVKRAKRGSLEYVKVGSRYHFTQAQVERASK